MHQTGQMTVRMLIAALEQEQPEALVVWVDVWNSSSEVLHALKSVDGNGGPVVKLRTSGPDDFSLRVD